MGKERKQEITLSVNVAVQKQLQGGRVDLLTNYTLLEEKGGESQVEDQFWLVVQKSQTI